MAALASGDLSTNWIKATRRWALVAWLFLSLGLILGGRWAYDVLGWGGYWGWDPVENAAFLQWLIGTAFLLPMTLAYTAYVYWLFRGKVSPGSGYH